MSDEQSTIPQHKEMRVLEIVGCFLMFFAVLLLIGIGGGKTASDRITNLVSALILLAIGLGMFWRGIARRKGAWILPVVLFASLAAFSAIAAFCITRLVPEERETPAKVEERQGEEPQQVEQKGGRSFLVKELARVGEAMKEVVEGISLSSVKCFTVVGLMLIAAVVWLVRRETVFEGVVDKRWWRDLRLWTLIVMASQVIIYLLLGT